MTNIAPRLEAQLDSVSLRQLRGMAAVAEIHGAQLYLVGGAVRDALLGLPVTDIDIAVVGMASGLPRGVARALNGRVVAHSQFNTFALSAAGRHIDLAMARHETYATPGALPTVAPGTLRQDLARRDFTINAMAVAIAENAFGDLHDPLDGRSDLASGAIRVLHDDSFRDDATRMIRAARYACRLDFTLESETERLIRRDIPFLETISSARLRDEFLRVLSEGRAASILEMLHSLGVLEAIHPALKVISRTTDALQRADRSQCADMPSLLLSVLTYEMNGQDRSEFADRLALDAQSRKVIQDTEELCARLEEITQIPSRSETHFLLQAYEEAAIIGCSLYEGDTPFGRLLSLYLDELRYVKPLLNGDDLLALGISQGPQIGGLLQNLLVARLDQELETRQDEIDFVRARL